MGLGEGRRGGGAKLALPVDHPLVAPQRSWRTATIVATAIAGVELVLLLGGAFLLLGKSLLPDVERAATREATRPAPVYRAPAAAPEPATKARPAPPLARANTHVLVLNGNGQTGAAASAAQLVQARGYPAAETSNAKRNDYPRSIVMYAPGFSVEAKRFARDLNVQIVTALDGLRKGDLHGAQLALVVGRN